MNKSNKDVLKFKASPEQLMFSSRVVV
jgi:hypothetical protein